MDNAKTGGSMDLSFELSKIAREVDRARHTLSSIEARHKGEKTVPEATAKVTDINKILLDAAENLMDFFDKSLENQARGLGLVDDLKDWIDKNSDSEKGDEARNIADKIAGVFSATKEGFNSMYPVMGFQDLAGQRLKKLSNELYDIEKKVITIAVTTGMDLDDHEKMLLDELNDNSLPIILRQDRVDEILEKFGV